MRRLLIITAVMSLAGAGIASAAGGGTATVTLTPSTASAPAGIAISLAGLSGNSGLPSSVAVLLQPGFTASARSLPVLCTAQQSQSNGCPSTTQIGTGSVGATFLGESLTVPINLFLAAPVEPGDIAAVILSGTLDGINLTISGRLFVPAQGGLELLLSSFPSEPVTLDSLTLSGQASQTVTTTVIKRVTKTITTGKGKHKHKKKIKKKVKKTIKTVYSLITNPSTCTGAWTGTATLTYSSGTYALPFSVACT
jgi:hypothetical protein